MTEWTTDADLGAALIDLGAHVAVPEHSLWTRVRAGLDERAPRRAVLPIWAVAAAVIAVVVVVAIVSIAPARHAVADLLGIGATEVQHVDRLPGTEASPPLPSAGDPAALAAQLAAHGLFAPDVAVAGAPVAWRVDPKHETVVAYRRATLSQRAVEGAVPSIKQYAGAAGVQFVTVGNEPAIFVPGEHTRTVAGHTFRSTSALIWDDDGIELRLEGDLPLDQLLAVARSVERAG
jgi:hypothetical protein